MAVGYHKKFWQAVNNGSSILHSKKYDNHLRIIAGSRPGGVQTLSSLHKQEAADKAMDEYLQEANYALTQLGQVQVVLQMLSEGKITMALSVHKNVAEAELANAAKIGAVVAGVFSVLVAPFTGGASLAFAAALIGATLGASAAALEKDWKGVATNIVTSAFGFKGYTPTSLLNKPVYGAVSKGVRNADGGEVMQRVAGGFTELTQQQVDNAITNKASSTLGHIFKPPPTVMEQILRDGLGDKAFEEGASFLNPEIKINNFEKYGAIIEKK